MLGHLKSYQGVFNPEEVSILTTVFDEAWKTVQGEAGVSALNGEAQAMRESIARRIIALALLGERDPSRLRQEALRDLAQNANETGRNN